MDIQFIGEKSAILNWYITKYTTKAEKSHSNAAFAEVTSTKSLASRLWNVALRSLSNRECGAMEVSDTLLGISLYETDPETVFRWADVNMIRSRKVRNFQEINDLPEDSEDLFHASWIDTYYPNRPVDLEDTNLYDFLAWYDIGSDEPKRSAIYFPFFDRFLKKRSNPYLTGFWKTVPNHTFLFQYIYHCHMKSIAFSMIFHSTTWNSMLKLLKECKKYSVNTYA